MFGFLSLAYLVCCVYLWVSFDKIKLKMHKVWLSPRIVAKQHMDNI